MTDDPSLHEWLAWLSHLTPSELHHQLRRHGIDLYTDPTGGLWYKVDPVKFAAHGYVFAPPATELQPVLRASAFQLLLLMRPVEADSCQPTLLH